jgi:DNA-binding NtrC family response regulator
MSNIEISRACQTTMASLSHNILLVDDELDSQIIFREMLSDLGYNVTVKSDGTSALQTIHEEGKIDLIITDYQMPDLSGLEFIRRVRKVHPAVPIIMITAYGGVETYLKSLSLGVFEFISKPVGKKMLGLIVNAALHNTSNGQASS